MDNKKDDVYYMRKALEEIGYIIEYTKGIDSYEQFMLDRRNLDSVMFRLIQLVEHIKNLSKEFRNEHSNIAWGQIIGFRNGIVHEYGKTDYTIVYETVTENIYELKELFEQHI